ncbi:hypothetical protein HK097_009945 [Rhizophlyctis rosea]|uniref:N-terminal Ras-GEF domain-containing protein n=1 Tax=Rhizophlyctis rosea TaxID=64517 RepID=A0AAD5SHM8_9FUNG|nr:hypothetical protein HK097_009945 [Rhizophlyctis rosea]
MEVINLVTKGDAAGLAALLENDKDTGKQAERAPTINVDSQDVQGNTPLHLAAARSEGDAVRLLLDAGASMSAKNIRGNRPIDYAKDRDIETLLVERMSISRTSPPVVDRSPAAEPYREWEAELPYDVQTLRPFCIDVIVSHSIFQERCKETIRQLIEEKQIAQHKNRLLEVRVQMLEHAAMQQEEYYRNNVAELMKQHQEQLAAVSERKDETEKAFLTYQKSHSHELAELSRLRTEVEHLTKERPLSRGDGSTDAVEIHALRKELADVKTQNVQLESRLKLAEKLKGMSEKETADIRKEMEELRVSKRDDIMKSLHDAHAQDERDQKDESTGDVIFVDGEGPKKRIKGATAEKLIERLTDPTVYDNQFQQAILLTHKTFMNSSGLIDAIAQRYKDAANVTGGDGGTGGQTPLLVRSRIVNTLKYWIENFWSDFSEDPILLEKLTAFADAIEEENLANVMKTIITRKLNGNVNMVPPKTLREIPKPILPKVLLKRYSDNGPRMSMHLGADRPASLQLGPGMPWPAKNAKKGELMNDVKLKLVELEPIEIARQLTLIEFDLFKAVKVLSRLFKQWTDIKLLTACPAKRILEPCMDERR